MNMQSRGSHYPDDMRQYDNDPRSPFYDNSHEEVLEERATEIAAEMLSEDGFKEGSVIWGIGDVTDRIYSRQDDIETFEKILAAIYNKESREAGLIFFEAFMERHAKAAADDIACREVE